MYERHHMNSIDWKMLKHNWDILAIGVGYPILLLITGSKYPSFNVLSFFLFVIVGLLLVILRVLTFRFMSFYTHEWKRKFGASRTFLLLAAALVVVSVLSSTVISAGLLREVVSITLIYIVVIVFYSDKRQHFTARQSTVRTFKPRNPKDLN